MMGVFLYISLKIGVRRGDMAVVKYDISELLTLKQVDTEKYLLRTNSVIRILVDAVDDTNCVFSLLRGTPHIVNAIFGFLVADGASCLVCLEMEMEVGATRRPLLTDEEKGILQVRYAAWYGGIDDWFRICRGCIDRALTRPPTPPSPPPYNDDDGSRDGHPVDFNITNYVNYWDYAPLVDRPPPPQPPPPPSQPVQSPPPPPLPSFVSPHELNDILDRTHTRGELDELLVRIRQSLDARRATLERRHWSVTSGPCLCTSCLRRLDLVARSYRRRSLRERRAILIAGRRRLREGEVEENNADNEWHFSGSLEQ